MKFNTKAVTRAVARKSLKVKHNSPHIFFGLGVAGVLGGAFLACRATLKVEEVIDEGKADVETVKKAGPYASEQMYYRDLTYVYSRTGLRLARLYGPSVLMGGAAIAALTGSHVQLTRRNSALTFTLAAVSKAYDEYRVRVREEIGEKRELDIYQGVREEKQDVDGKKKTVAVRDSTGFSPYARCFDETSWQWQKSAELNRMFLQCQQNYLNHRLNAYGHVFLNEAYDALGLERTTPGSVVGWVINGEGDDYIDFGFNDPRNAAFLNGQEQSVWLDFNVDGVIYDKI